MVELTEQSTQQRLETLNTALHSGTAEQVRQLLSSLHPAFEPLHQAPVLWQ